MERHLAVFGDAIPADALELGGERKHGAKDFTNGSKVVVGDPAAKAQEYFIEDRRRIDDAQNILGGNFRLVIVHADDDAHHALLAERDQHTSSDNGSHIGRDMVCEGHVERHGQGYVAEVGHWWKDKLHLSVGDL